MTNTTVYCQTGDTSKCCVKDAGCLAPNLNVIIQWVHFKNKRIVSKEINLTQITFMLNVTRHNNILRGVLQ